MKKILLLLVTFTSLNSVANISGKWIGKGIWTYDSAGTNCFMNFTFRDTANKLERLPTYFDCEMVGLDVPGEVFLKDGNILKNSAGEKIGSYSENKITYSEMFNGNVEVFTTINVDGLHFDYEENWKMKDGSTLYKIKGRLFTDR